jgi:archaellum biogenesis protein FlaJ (TadC family)
MLLSMGASLVIFTFLLMLRPGWDLTIAVIAASATPLLLPGAYMLIEQNRIVRRDEAFGAFMRTIGSTSESKGGSASMGLKRIRWHYFGQLTEQVRALYDRLKLRIDAEKAWTLFSRETRSELISQFLSTYQEGISAGGSPKDVSTMVSGHFTTLQSLRKRRYMMADNFAAILYSLTVFISASLFMIHAVILEIIERLADLGSSSPELTSFQDIVLLKNVEGLGGLMLASILSVIVLHVLFSADTIRRFKGGHPLTTMVHVPLLFWTAAAAGYAASWAVGRIL